MDEADDTLVERWVRHSSLKMEKDSGSGLHAGPRQHPDRRQPLSSVSSLEVHVDLLDLSELTDTSDSEFSEVFVESDENPHCSSPTSLHHPLMRMYMLSPSWRRRSKCTRPHKHGSFCGSDEVSDVKTDGPEKTDGSRQVQTSPKE